jgi:ribosomal protein S18 acetylase RimI-like enzyme
MTALRIVKADLADSAHAAGIVDVLDSYASDPVGGGRPLRAEVRERLASVLRAHPTTLVLLAMADGRAVGIAVCFFGVSTFEARPPIYVHDLAVVPDFRGRGIGRALLAEAEKRAVERGCCKLTLEVQDGNLVARSLYQSFGFRDFVFGDSGPTRYLTKPLHPAEPVGDSA